MSHRSGRMSCVTDPDSSDKAATSTPGQFWFSADRRRERAEASRLHIRGVNVPGPADSYLIVSRAKRYAHAQVRTMDDVTPVTELVRAQYARSTA